MEHDSVCWAVKRSCYHDDRESPGYRSLECMRLGFADVTQHTNESFVSVSTLRGLLCSIILQAPFYNFLLAHLPVQIFYS